MADQELKIKIAIDAKTGKISLVNQAVDELSDSVENSSKKTNTLRQGIEDLAHAGLAMDTLKKAFNSVKSGAIALLDTAGEFEKYKAVLTTLEGSSQKAGKSFEWVQNFAATTPYQLNEVTQAFVKLKSYGINPTDGTLKTLGNTSAAFGKNINDAVEMLADAMTGENERLKEFGIKANVVGNNIKYSWSDSSGKAREAVVANNSKIIKSTLSAIFNEKYPDTMDQMSSTWEGLTSNMADNWTMAINKIAVQSGFFDGAKAAVVAFNKEFKTILNNQEYMDVLGTGIKWMAVGIIQVVQSVSQAFTGWAMVWETLKVSYQQLKMKILEGTDTISLKLLQMQAGFDKVNPFSKTKQAQWDAAIALQKKKIEAGQAQWEKLGKGYDTYIKQLDSSNKIFDDLQDAFLQTEKGKQTELAKTSEAYTKTTSTIVTKSAAQVAAEQKAKDAQKKLEQEYAKWSVNLSEETAKAKASDVDKPYVALTLQYEKDLAKYGKFTDAKNKLDKWYSAKLDKLNAATIKEFNKTQKQKEDALEKEKQQETNNLIASSKQRQEYYESIGDYASAWAELEQVLRLKNTDLTKEQLDEKIKAEEKAYKQSKGIYDDLYDAIKDNITQSTKDWSNYNKIVGNGFSSMVTGLQSTLQSSLVDVFEGKIKSIGDFFGNLWSSIKKSFFNMVAEIASKEILMNFMNAWKPGGNTGQGFVEKFLGIDIPFLNFAKGTIWGDGKYGIAGNGYSGKDSYANDTIPALISKGEAVIPASAVNQNKSVVSALIAGSRLDNKDLLNVSYVKSLAKAANFAQGYDPNDLGLFDKASIDAEGVYHLKGGGKSGIAGAILGGIIGAFTGGLGSVLIGAALGGAGLLDPIIEMVSTVFKPFMKNAWLGWLAQAAIALYAPYLIPHMLNSDLLSAGITLASGGNLSDALGGAGVSGLIAGGASALSSLINTGALPATKLTFWETLKNYPSTLYDTMLDKISDIKEFFNNIKSVSALADPDAYINLDKQNWLLSDSNLSYDDWVTKEMEAQYSAMSSSTLFNGTSFANAASAYTPYTSAYTQGLWGLSSYDLIGQPAANMSIVDTVTSKLTQGLDYAANMGTTAYESVSDYLIHPEKILQYILDNIEEVLNNLAIGITSISSSPLVSALIGNSLANSDSPFKNAGVTAFANGGIVTAPTLGLIGEAGYAEAVIPLHKLGEITQVDELKNELEEMKVILRQVLRATKTTATWTQKFAIDGIKTI